MGRVNLVPSANQSTLAIVDIVRRLRDEFNYVLVDEEEGRDDVANVIAATFRLSKVWPDAEERIAALQAVQNEAVYVWFGDDASLTAGCCLKPGWGLWFGRTDEVCGPARPLVERAATALGYIVED